MAKNNSKPNVLQVNDVKGVVQFEPTATPLTQKRGLKGDEHPTYSLSKDGRIYVYGALDCFNHGEGVPARLNSFERYGASEAYLDLLKVQWLHLFAALRGKETITPTGVISVPISVFNYRDDDTGENTILNDLRAMIINGGKAHQIEDAEGCQLKIKIDDKRLIILPESVGALFHYHYDHLTLKPRGDKYDVSGNVLVVDVGYLTTDLSLHIDSQYQRNRAFTEPNLGLGLIAQAIADELGKAGKHVDISQIDAAMRLISDSEPGAPKFIEIAGKFKVEVATVYDPMITDLATSIAHAIRNRFKEPLNRVILAGGGTYHLHQLIARLLSVPVMICPNAAASNVLGGFTRLRQQAQQTTGVKPTLLYAIDNGNGLSKGVSSDTLR